MPPPFSFFFFFFLVLNVGSWPMAGVSLNIMLELASSSDVKRS